MKMGVYPPLEYVLSSLKRLSLKLFYGIIYFWTASLTLLLLIPITYGPGLLTHNWFIFILVSTALLFMSLLSAYAVGDIEVLLLFHHREYLVKGKSIFVISQYLIAISAVFNYLTIFFSMIFYNFYQLLSLASFMLMALGFFFSIIGIIIISAYLFNFGLENKMFVLMIGSVFLALIPGVGALLAGASLYQATEDLNILVTKPQIVEKIEKYLIQKINEEKRPVSAELAVVELGVPNLALTYITNKLLGEEKISGYKYKGFIYPL